MYPIASSTADINTALTNLGTLIALVVSAVLIAWAGLVGLGFLRRKATHYVTGRKF